MFGIKAKLVSSQAYAEVVKAYADEMNRLHYDRRAQAATDRKIARIEKHDAGHRPAAEV